jgi:uncharacterized membrane protein YdjX (TVP38/TMEM64 family)
MSRGAGWLGSARLRWAILVGLLAALPLSLLVVGAPSQIAIQRAVDAAGLLAPVAFIALYVGWTVLLLPGVVPTLVGGALFGIVAGTLLTMIGAVIGATLAFLIGRRLGREQVQTLAGHSRVRFERWLSRRGFLARLVPIVPFNLLNYAAGVTGMRTRSYVIATAVGIVPGTVVCTALGSTASRPGSGPFLASLAAVGVLTLVVAVLAPREHLVSEPRDA